MQDINHDNKHSLPPSYLLRLTLLSNRALCYVKISETLNNSVDKNTNTRSWRDAALKAEQDCTTAINELDKVTLSQSSNANEIRSLRAKILFRRAKAYYIQTNVNDEDNANLDHNQLLNDAAKDLLQLLSFDTNNSAATSLLRKVRERHASSKATPLTKALQDLKQNLPNINDNEGIEDQKSWDQQFDNLKLMYGALCQDIASGSMELGRKGVVQTLTQIFTIPDTNNLDDICLSADTNKETQGSYLIKSKALAIQILSLSVSHLPFAISFIKPHQFRQSILNTIILECKRQQHQPKQIDIAIAVISLMLRIVIAFHNESPEIMNKNTNSSSSNEIAFMDNYVDGSAISQICLTSMNFSTNKDNRLKRAAIDLLSTWTSSNWEDIALSASSFTNTISQVKKKEQLSESDIQSLPPRQFAAYRKREYDISLHKKLCAKRNVLLFCDEQTGGLHTLLNSAIDCGDDNRIRKEIVLLLGRMLYIIVEDYGSGKEKKGEKIVKKLVGPLLGFDGSINEEEEKVDGLKIEEIYDDDEDNDDDDDEEIDNNINMYDKLKQDMIRALLTSSLLLCDAEVGSWALSKAWANGNSSESIRNLIKSGNFLAMSIVSELLSAAASVEKARPLLGPIVQGGELQILLESDSSLIRSGAASALAKLGLSSKTVENADGEGEVLGLLQVAVDLIYDDDEELETTTTNQSNERNSDGPNHTTTERGIELLSYLASKTLVKEEIAHGFRSPKSPPNKTALNRLVEIARNEKITADSTTCYGIATIFAQLAVSLETLRKEAFIGKDVTAEQYEELQALGKTEEEKEAAKESKEMELDPPESVNSRIRKMANADVPLAMIKLMNACGYGGENTSHESTLEQLVIGMERMAIETSVRGIMVQQGCLSACIKLEQGVSKI